jgi:hypothetical protein
MKAGRRTAAPRKYPQPTPALLKSGDLPKKEKLQIAPDSLLKTKGQKKCS